MRGATSWSAGSGLGGIVLLLGCGGEPPPDPPREPAELVDAARWQVRNPDLDPLGHRTPDHVPCGGGDIRPEDDTLEIDTQRCNFALVGQPLLESVRRGDVLELELWWQILISDRATTAHLAVLLDARLLWEEAVRVPGPADRRLTTFEAPADYPAGSEVLFHLHNHGYNNYRIGGLRRR